MKYKNKTLGNNILMNIIKSFTNSIFPIITLPYITRVLQPEGLGKVQFAISIVSYFTILAMFGVTLYATRECASVRDNKLELSTKVHEFVRILSISTVVSYLVLFICVLTIPKLKENSYLILITSVGIIFSVMGVEWLYQALEEFRYITIRSIVVKCISTVLLFLFVKSPKDVLIYTGIYLLSSVGSNLLNFINLRSYIFTKPIKDLYPTRHLKGLFIMFAMNISTSIYANLDSIMLGFIQSDDAVGFYTSANKLVHMAVLVMTTISIALLPRISYYFANKQLVKMDELMDLAISGIFFFSIPIMIFFISYAEPIMMIMSGRSFLPAVPTMQILSPIIFLIALSNLVGIQYLLSIGKEKITTISVIVGAVSNFILNIILIPKHSYLGAALAILIAEALVLMVQVVCAWRYLKKYLCKAHFLKYIFGGTVFGLCSQFIVIQSNMYINMIIGMLVSSLAYLLILWILRDKFLLYLLTHPLQVFRKKYKDN